MNCSSRREEALILLPESLSLLTSAATESRFMERGENTHCARVERPALLLDTVLTVTPRASLVDGSPICRRPCAGQISTYESQIQSHSSRAPRCLRALYRNCRRGGLGRSARWDPRSHSRQCKSRHGGSVRCDTRPDEMAGRARHCHRPG